MNATDFPQRILRDFSVSRKSSQNALCISIIDLIMKRRRDALKGLENSGFPLTAIERKKV